MILTALVVAMIWFALDRRPLQYQTAAAWLRFLLRLTLVYAMCTYGFGKLFPLQMAPPSLAVLNESLGQSSPMTLLWTLIGLNPVYEMICGAAEVAAAVLLFFRRTALIGALLTGFVMTNVLLITCSSTFRSNFAPHTSSSSRSPSLFPTFAPCSTSSGTTSPPRPPASGSHRPSAALSALVPSPLRSSSSSWS